jgi:aminodeoxyfutalosine deaminase
LQSFYAFTDFPHFLEVYAKVSSLVRTGEDVLTLLDGLGAQLAASTVRYAEIQVGPLRHRDAGISFAELSEALCAGHTAVAAQHGVELGWIIAADAAHGPPGARQALQFAISNRPEGTVGIGLGGPEHGAPRADYTEVFRTARAAGLHCVSHAGETVGAAEVWSALRMLGAERIGHGLGAARDEVLLAHLAHEQIALEVCPTSNLCTGAVASLDAHPLPTFLAAGVPVAICTDDPGMFETDLNAEYLLCHTEFGLDAGELVQLARTSAQAAFCSPETRDALLTEIDQIHSTVSLS